MKFESSSRRAYTRYANLSFENLSGVAIRCGQDRPDEYGKTDGQDVKQGDITNAPIEWTVSNQSDSRVTILKKEVCMRGRSKYGVRHDAEGVAARTIDGIKFDSLAEAKRYSELKLLYRAGKISFAGRQAKFDLIVNGILICRYKVDFQYLDHKSNTIIHEDVKGVRTPVYKLKKKLMKACHDIDIVEV